MAEIFYNTKFIQSLLLRRRRKRTYFVLSKVNTFEGMSVLDVGCGPNGRSFEDFAPKDYRIIGIDILNEKKVKMNHPYFKYVKQSAQDLRIFSDNEFNLAVSFGMMEHICDHAVLKNMYSEIDRVSQQWAIIVPWKYALVEPHFKFPFFQLLPYSLKVFLVETFNLHNLKKSVKQDYNYIKKHYQWFTNRQWLDIFKGAKCYITPHLDTVVIVKQ